MRRGSLALCCLPLLLAGCQREQPPEKPVVSAQGVVNDADIPPVQPRPDNLGPSVKWPAESGRYQQIRRQAWHEGLDVARLPQPTLVAGRRGQFQVRLLSTPAHRVLREESWRIRVETPDGKPASVSTVHVGGGMPEHGHGLPTQPSVRGGGKPGEFVVDGLQFGMPGWWEVSFFVADARHDDSMTFNVIAN